MELYPGAKNWIKKYFQLVEQEKIKMDHQPPDGLGEIDYLHTAFLKSGLSFGYPIEFLYVAKDYSENWTIDEQLRVLLFEGLIMVYNFHYKSFNEENWKKVVLQFYSEYNTRSSTSVFDFFRKSTPNSQLEELFSRRVHIRKTFSNMLWVNYLNNGMVYLDVLAFHYYLSHTTKENKNEDYTSFATLVIQTLALATYSDGAFTPQEKTLVDVFIASSDLPQSTTKEIIEAAKDGKLNLTDLKLPVDVNDLFMYYLIDLAVLVVYTDLEAGDKELSFLHRLCTFLGIETEYLKQSLVLIEGFVLQNNHKILFLQENTSYDRLYRSFSRRWIKVLGRNKDKLVHELRQNQELLALVNKSFTQDLTSEEKDKVKYQFREVVKSMPAVAIFMLPGGAILLPIIMRIIPDLVPSAFKKNDVDEKE